MLLRPRQKQFVERSVQALGEHGNTLGVAPTGAGKTIILSAVAGRLVGGSEAKACVLAHRDELTAQNRSKFGRVNPRITTSVVDAREKSWGAQVTFAMVPTLARASNLDQIPALDLLAIDEAHHAAADSYRRIIDTALKRNPMCRIYGVTATPSRATAHLVSRDDKDRPVYGGTPADFAVVQAIKEMKARGLRVTFYPFLLMDVPPGNALPNPYSDNAAETGQPAFPWRGRITCSPAAGFAGSVDKTATAAAHVAAFFGSADTSDFAVSGAPVLVSLGAPILGSILRTNVGGIAGEASAQVVEALAQTFGAQPTPEAVKAAIEADPKAATKVQAIERERSAEWVAYLTMATSQRDHMLDREDQRGSVFSWGWRPAMSWMLLFLWSWNGVILPVANATAGTSIVPIPWEHLLGFAGLWLAIYGGGHTIKSVLGR